MLIFILGSHSSSLKITKISSRIKIFFSVFLVKIQFLFIELGFYRMSEHNNWI
jgi:hypothetical protein